MDCPLCQIKNKPAVHRSEKKLTPFCPLSCIRHMIQYPGYLRGTKISVWHKPGFFPYHVSISGFNQLIHFLSRPAALPYNRIIDRLPRGLIPHYGGFPLICDAYCSNILRGKPCHGHSLHCYRQLGGPNLFRIVLYPARVRINLPKLLLGHA